MTDLTSLSLPEIEIAWAILRDNILQLVEQAAGSSGAQDDARTSDRIAQQTEELEALVQEHDRRSKA